MSDTETDVYSDSDYEDYQSDYSIESGNSDRSFEAISDGSDVIFAEDFDGSVEGENVEDSQEETPDTQEDEVETQEDTENNSDEDLVTPRRMSENYQTINLELEILRYDTPGVDPPLPPPLPQTDDPDPPLPVPQPLLPDEDTEDSTRSTEQCITPPSGKKRKRSADDTPIQSKDSPGDTDDSSQCPICLDDWEMSGEHRLVALKCGHLFGHSCIKRWLHQCGNANARCCPQCKSRATLRDVRYLYAKRLRAVDRTEEYRLKDELRLEREKTIQALNQLTTMELQRSLLNKRLVELQAENDRLVVQMAAFTGQKVGPLLCTQSNSSQFGRGYKLFLEKNIEISKEPGCRVMLYSPKNAQLLVSQKSPQAIFRGYGIRFIDTTTFRLTTFLHTATKSLRDVSVTAMGDMLVTASMEKQTKLFDVNNRSVASIFETTESPVWSCALDRGDRSNVLYLGAQHGTTYTFDLRNTSKPISEVSVEGDCSPVIHISPIPASEHFPFGGFVVCKLQSVWFYEYTHSSEIVSTKLANIDGPFVSMNYDPLNDTLVLFARPSAKHDYSRYIWGRMIKVNGIALFDVKYTFLGSKVTPLMTRCTQIPVQSNTLLASYIQDAKLLSLFDMQCGAKLQSLSVTDVVFDTCPIVMGATIYLGALTETKCRIYKLNSQS